MNAEEIDAALDDVFDQAMVFHSYTDYTRDDEIVTYSVAGGSTGIPPRDERHCPRPSSLISPVRVPVRC